MPSIQIKGSSTSKFSGFKIAKLPSLNPLQPSPLTMKDPDENSANTSIKEAMTKLKKQKVVNEKKPSLFIDILKTDETINLTKSHTDSQQISIESKSQNSENTKSSFSPCSKMEKDSSSIDLISKKRRKYEKSYKSRRSRSGSRRSRSRPRRSRSRSKRCRSRSKRSGSRIQRSRSRSKRSRSRSKRSRSRSIKRLRRSTSRYSESRHRRRYNRKRSSSTSSTSSTPRRYRIRQNRERSPVYDGRVSKRRNRRSVSSDSSSSVKRSRNRSRRSPVRDRRRTPIRYQNRKRTSRRNTDHLRSPRRDRRRTPRKNKDSRRTPRKDTDRKRSTSKRKEDPITKSSPSTRRQNNENSSKKEVEVSTSCSFKPVVTWGTKKPTKKVNSLNNKSEPSNVKMNVSVKSINSWFKDDESDEENVISKDVATKSQSFTDNQMKSLENPKLEDLVSDASKKTSEDHQKAISQEENNKMKDESHQDDELELMLSKSPNLNNLKQDCPVVDNQTNFQKDSIRISFNNFEANDDNGKVKNKNLSFDRMFANVATSINQFEFTKQKASKQPVGETPVEKLVAETLVEKPAGETPVEKLVAETPVEKPAGETPVEKPVAETPVEKPVGETPVETPVGETPVETPVAETPVGETPIDILSSQLNFSSKKSFSKNSLIEETDKTLKIESSNQAQDKEKQNGETSPRRKYDLILKNSCYKIRRKTPAHITKPNEVVEKKELLKNGNLNDTHDIQKVETNIRKIEKVFNDASSLVSDTTSDIQAPFSPIHFQEDRSLSDSGKLVDISVPIDDEDKKITTSIAADASNFSKFHLNNLSSHNQTLDEQNYKSFNKRPQNKVDEDDRMSYISLSPPALSDSQSDDEIMDMSLSQMDLQVPVDINSSLETPDDSQNGVLQLTETCKEEEVSVKKEVKSEEVESKPAADEDDEDSSKKGCRRSRRIQSNSRKSNKLNIQDYIDKIEMTTNSPNQLQPVTNQPPVVANQPTSTTSQSSLLMRSEITSSEDTKTCQSEHLQPPTDYEVIEENIHLGDPNKFRVRKEIRKMVCECYQQISEKNINEIVPCSESCLNRLLMIECSKRCPFGDLCTNKRLQRRHYMETEVFQTPWKGWGLRAKNQIIGGGKLVMEYVGEVLDHSEFERRSFLYSKNNQQHFYFMALSQDEVIDATYKGNISRFINHSCDPNCETQKWTVNGHLKVGFFTLKTIEAGEEITFDYQYERYGKEAQVCHCGTPKCRGFLGRAPDDDDLIQLDNCFEYPGEEDVKIDQYNIPEKKMKKKRKKLIGFEDALQKELTKYRFGLRNQDEVITLSRCMLRCQSVEQRSSCLKIIQKTNNPVLLRKFLRLHGLTLLWSWMIDLSSVSSDADVHLFLANQQMKIEVLSTLKLLPITNKNMIEDSKVLQTVVRWKNEKDRFDMNKKESNINEEDKDFVCIEYQKNIDQNSKDQKDETVKDQKNPSIEDQKDEDIEDQKDQNIEDQKDEDIEDQKDEIVKDQKNPSIEDQNDENIEDQKDQNIEDQKDEDIEDQKDQNIENQKDEIVEDQKEVESKVKDEEIEDRKDHEPIFKNQNKENLEIKKDSEDQKDLDQGIEDQMSPKDRKVEDDEETDRKSLNNLKDSEEVTSVKMKESEEKEFEMKLELEDLSKEVNYLTVSLLEDWKDLKEIYRIPKKVQPTKTPRQKSSTPEPTPATSERRRDKRSFHRHHERYRRRYHSRNHQRHRSANDSDLHPHRFNGVHSSSHSESDSTIKPKLNAVSALVDDIVSQYANIRRSTYNNCTAPSSVTTLTSFKHDAISYSAPKSLLLQPTASSKMKPSEPPLFALLPKPSGFQPGSTPGTSNLSASSDQQQPSKPDVEILGSAGDRTIVSLTSEQLEQLKKLTQKKNGESGSSFGHKQNRSSTNLVVDWLNNRADFSDCSDHTPPEKIKYPSRSASSQPLQPNWLHATDSDGYVYYYHAITRQTQWEPPVLDDRTSKSTPSTSDEKASRYQLANQERMQKKLKAAEIASDVDDAKRARDIFIHQMSPHVVKCLQKYKKKDFQIGRKGFKTLARKLTHLLMKKELKEVQVWEDLEVNANVVHKATEYVKDYMSKLNDNKSRDNET